MRYRTRIDAFGAVSLDAKIPANPGRPWQTLPARRLARYEIHPRAVKSPVTARVIPLAREVAAPDASAIPERIAWDQVIATHERRVVVALVARGIPLERAKEFADDAWVKIIGQFRAGRLAELKLPGLVVAQALFLARDAQRQAMRRAALAPMSSGDVAAIDQDELDLEERLLAREQLRKIAKIVEAASPSARRIFELTWGDSPRPAAEVAEELGISVQRVRQVACELRKRLRGVIGGRGDE